MLPSRARGHQLRRDFIAWQSATSEPATGRPAARRAPAAGAQHAGVRNPDLAMLLPCLGSGCPHHVPPAGSLLVTETRARGALPREVARSRPATQQQAHAVAPGLAGGQLLLGSGTRRWFLVGGVAEVMSGPCGASQRSRGAGG